ncbi:MAG: hypothetical protein ACRDA3_13235 [Peptostreptococcaceae bacterium]
MENNKQHMSEFVTAIRLTRKYFKDILDKGDNPYEDHLLTVAGKVGNRTKVVALLHDILEDTECTREELLESNISENVIKSVEILTRGQGEAYVSYIDRIVDSNDIDALVVKKADLEDNMNLSRLKRIEQIDIDRVSKRYLPAYMKISNKIKDLGI